MFDVYLDNKSASSEGLSVVKRPSFPGPSKKQNEFNIPGMDGMLYEKIDLYNDIQVPIVFNYMCNEAYWHEMFRKSKKWILNAKELVLKDDPDYYHKIKKVEINTNDRNSLKIGRFEVVFTLDPYYYLTNGKKEYSIKDCLINIYSFCKPVYIIKGEGQCTLLVNNSVMKANVSGNLTIDSNLKISYKDNDIKNTSVKGDYEGLWLYDENNISITNGFELKIIPNWRSL